MRPVLWGMRGECGGLRYVCGVHEGIWDVWGGDIWRVGVCMWRDGGSGVRVGYVGKCRVWWRENVGG